MRYVQQHNIAAKEFAKQRLTRIMQRWGSPPASALASDVSGARTAHADARETADVTKGLCG
jgi:hypothetical protein